uniref:DUF3592 domain-containing protein n=1 Tax=Caenorhabditis tropicalis TaxID=1561998 RepID=A0A1I7U680_9PELO
MDELRFGSTIFKILAIGLSYVIFTSLGIFIHWMWFSNYDLVIGRRVQKSRLKPGERLYLNGLALSSTYYAEQIRIAAEEAKLKKEALLL